MKNNIKTKKFLKEYKVPGVIEKAMLYAVYLVRQTYWNCLDLKKLFNRNKSEYKLSDIQIAEFCSNGILKINGVFDAEEVDVVVGEIEKTRNKLVGQDINLKKFPGRMTNSHSVNKEVFDFLTDDRITNILSRILDGDPILWGSLAFNFGSQQSAHSDSPWFYTEPHNAMVGVWVALEDINPASGPIFYVPKSHKSLQKVADVLKFDGALMARVENFRRNNISASDRKFWELSKEVEDLYVAEWKNTDFNRQIICPKKGDVVIWHQYMIHGGTPRVDESLTRKSIVSHWIRRNSKSFSQQNFFLNFDNLDDRKRLKLPIKSNILGKKYLRQYYSRVFDWS